ncbi:hypothetical protein BPAE_0002g01940 [Botrytis paeoniae]|uniref:Uncharacterized protein n=1 Tax=Botrytis paeoniae TaxID=278948 RepID=A0A4Z1G5H6_9HELO|nr:hypothetical protein BPAE_0002g01940 [Botrytis paeoniae]
MEESANTRILELAQKANLAHPGLPLVKVFLSDAADGDQAAKHILETYSENRNDVDFTRFLRDWKDLVRLYTLLMMRKSMWGLLTREI